ncbi:hypothetical protein EMQ25_11950 [Arsenicitalea aurantiaca]|uniref:Uncharacterized protein n=1 Tax=Arsenicitalea aurantiaca TaxID=1783274 RepID=A0A433X7K3_9HYPH|nr:hypothetical protein EMQ25_11950 [Arsenicitalea aurantiaca]
MPYRTGSIHQDDTISADRDPQRSKEIPEVNTRQRDAPAGVVCVWRWQRWSPYRLEAQWPEKREDERCLKA